MKTVSAYPLKDHAIFVGNKKIKPLKLKMLSNHVAQNGGFVGVKKKEKRSYQKRQVQVNFYSTNLIY